jgi:type IV secretory pathway VirB2 component (pilin)
MKRLQETKSAWRKWAVSIAYAYGVVTFVWPVKAFAAVAAGGALPWDAPLTTLQNDLQGPVAHAITTAAIIGTGIMWSVSEHGTGVRKMSSLAFGGSCALVCNPADDDLIHTRWSALLGRIGRWSKRSGESARFINRSPSQFFSRARNGLWRSPTGSQPRP